MGQELSDDARKEILEYVNAVCSKREQYIAALLAEYYEQQNPNPEDVVLVEEHRGLKTIWYFSSKREQDLGDEVYNR